MTFCPNFLPCLLYFSTTPTESDNRSSGSRAVVFNPVPEVFFIWHWSSTPSSNNVWIHNYPVGRLETSVVGPVSVACLWILVLCPQAGMWNASLSNSTHQWVHRGCIPCCKLQVHLFICVHYYLHNFSYECVNIWIFVGVFASCVLWAPDQSGVFHYMWNTICFDSLFSSSTLVPGQNEIHSVR